MPAKHDILIIGPSWVGDMVMAQSLFAALKQRYPYANIDVLAPEWTRPLLARMPEIREAISMPVTHGVFGWKQRRQIGLSLRHKNYDQSIVLPNSWKSALIPWFANIPQRTGWLGEMRYGLLNDPRKLNKQNLPLMVQRFVALAHPASKSHIAPDYLPPRMIAEAISSELNPPKSAEQKRLVLCPGAEFGPAKQWPTTHYAALGELLTQQGWQVLIMGSKADAAVGEQIVAGITDKHNVINLCGKTQLGEAIDLIATADQVVSNDSGLMHIAAALNKPLVAIYGPTSPAFTPPLSDNARLVQIAIECSPCFQRTCPLGHHKCMQDILPEQIVMQLQSATS
ncbi:lipopolysaccharide heptosyltransferase II [Methylophaga sp.]|uniref:lipopolysaccharide heptosyltransferase II n=1 Tax=Methylophaga sp. TaxID=2024840 RepID=UPI002726DAE4|nr:lipopolysaccharide heptosyltransferase II [Methylophaga sp.]MDO8826445.1 lipopolysaccharide heptosyltransferase II [Methylophaga sp.]